MKIILNIIAVLLILAIGVWFLQGINVLPGSFMTGQIQRALQAAFTAVVHGQAPRYEGWLSYVQDVQMPVRVEDTVSGKGD
jgi:hypothetical protein